MEDHRLYKGDHVSWRVGNDVETGTVVEIHRNHNGRLNGIVRVKVDGWPEGRDLIDMRAMRLGRESA